MRLWSSSRRLPFEKSQARVDGNWMTIEGEIVRNMPLCGAHVHGCARVDGLIFINTEKGTDVWRFCQVSVTGAVRI